jgi:hypothetical protein
VNFFKKLFAKSEVGVAEYYKQISEAQTKIEETRANCPHRVFEVHMYMWRPGAMHPQRICVSCDAVVPGVTEDESNKAWLEWSNEMQNNSNNLANNIVNLGNKTE